MVPVHFGSLGKRWENWLWFCCKTNSPHLILQAYWINSWICDCFPKAFHVALYWTLCDNPLPKPQPAIQLRTQVPAAVDVFPRDQQHVPGGGTLRPHSPIPAETVSLTPRQMKNLWWINEQEKICLQLVVYILLLTLWQALVWSIYFNSAHFSLPFLQNEIFWFFDSGLMGTRTIFALIHFEQIAQLANISDTSLSRNCDSALCDNTVALALFFV